MTATPRWSTPELARRAGVDETFLERLVSLGVVEADPDGRFGSSDVHRVRLLHACEEAGLAIDAVGRAVSERRLSFGFMDLPNYRFSGLGTLTLRELAEQEQVPLDLALDLIAAQGVARPSPEDHPREDDVLFFRLMRTASVMIDRDALVRMARVYVDALRRIADAEAVLYMTYVVNGYQRQGLSLSDAMNAAGTFSAEVTPSQEQLIISLYRRQQERRWTETTVESIEEVIEEMGLHHRAARPPAIAFVDLAGYTRMTDERGDEEGARLAAAMGTMVNEVTSQHEGVPVKWLGDGVMVSFKRSDKAVRATLKMVERAPAIGLPAHAGIAAGPVVVQDGDVFGRTVNAAARIAAGASAGQTLVTDRVAELSQDPGLSFQEIGPRTLKGFAEPITLFEASGTSAG